MSNQVIHSEKVRRPVAVGLIRKRLENPFVDMSDGALGVVLGPAGSGKTTLLAQIAQAVTMPVGWYRVTDDDFSESTFVQHLAAAYFAAVEKPRMRPAGVDEFLQRLEADTDVPILLILDDLHEIYGQQAETVLEQFLTLRPRRIRVLLGSRKPPNINLSRLRVSGVVREILSDDLRFRSWEVEELFSVVHGEPLSPESSAALTRRTGGWAAGLQLFHLATTGRGPTARNRAVSELGAKSRLMRAYLAGNVLAGLSTQRRLFMVRTCGLGTMTGPLCDDLLGTQGSSAVLEELEREQLFTSTTDDGTTFRYHEVLQRHLELALLTEFGQRGVRGWYSRCAAILERGGAPREAIRAHARAEDWASVARLVQRETAGKAANVSLTLPGQLPEQLWQGDPWLALAEARRRVRRADLRGAIVAFAQAEALLDEPDFRHQCQQESAAAQLWLGGADRSPPWDHMAAAHRWTDQLRARTRRGLAPEASDQEAAPGPGRWSRSSDSSRIAEPDDSLIGGLSDLLIGHIDSAARQLQIVVLNDGAGALERVVAQFGIVVIEVVCGRCADPAAQFEEISLEAEVAGLAWVSRLARGVLAAVLAASETASWRWDSADQLLLDCAREGDEWGGALIQLCFGIAAETARQPDASDRYVDAAARFHELDAPLMQLWADVLAARGQPYPDVAHRADAAGRAEAKARSLRAPGLVVLSQTIARRADDVDLNNVVTLLRNEFETDHASLGTLAKTRSTSAGPGSEPPAVSRAEAQISVRLKCFGGFQLTVDDRAVSLDDLRPRARCLLRLFAARPNRDLHREWLIDMLWPGVAVDPGTRRLQVAVSSIRQVLADADPSNHVRVRRVGDAYRLELPVRSEVDVEQFERYVRTASAAAGRGEATVAIDARRRALELYRGDLLPEDGPAEYTVSERDRLRLLAAATASHLARDLSRSGQIDAAIAAARRSIELDRYSDIAWLLLADLLVLAGENNAASRVLSERARLSAEMAGPHPSERVGRTTLPARTATPLRARVEHS